MDLDHAIEKHTEWKLKFRSAISRHETMDVATIGDDHCCELGKWLWGDGKLDFGALKSFSTCVSCHTLFHTEAAKVAQAINAKRYTQAEAMLDSGTPYGSASSAVGVAIMRLKREAGL